MADQQTAFAVWQQEVETKITALENQNAALLSALHALKSSTQRPKAQLPEPDKLSAQFNWDTFEPEIEVKIEVDCEAITGIKFTLLADDSSTDPATDREVAHKVLFFYVYNRLESKIKAMTLPLLFTAKSTGRYRYTDLLDYFNRIWDTPNKKKGAQEKILSLSQGQNETFASLLARFERLLHEAGATKWADDIKIMHLRKAISHTLKRSLDVQLIVPDKYHDFIQACHQPAGRQGSNTHTGGGHGHGHGHGNNGDAMDLSVVATNNKPASNRTKFEEMCMIDAGINSINSINADASADSHHTLWDYEGYGPAHAEDSDN